MPRGRAGALLRRRSPPASAAMRLELHAARTMPIAPIDSPTHGRALDELTTAQSPGGEGLDDVELQRHR